jgi:hypothetical protein
MKTGRGAATDRRGVASFDVGDTFAVSIRVRRAGSRQADMVPYPLDRDVGSRGALERDIVGGDSVAETGGARAYVGDRGCEDA